MNMAHIQMCNFPFPSFEPLDYNPNEFVITEETPCQINDQEFVETQ